MLPTLAGPRWQIKRRHLAQITAWPSNAARADPMADKGRDQLSDPCKHQAAYISSEANENSPNIPTGPIKARGKTLSNAAATSAISTQAARLKRAGKRYR